MSERLKELEQIYRSTLPRFIRVATAVAGDEASGVDAVHDAFVACASGLSGFRRDGPMEGWVWRAVINSARRTRRDRRRDLALPPPELLPATNGHRSEEVETVRVALAALPERQRLAVFLRYYADLDYRGIGDALDISTGTVGALLNQAHTSLRRSLPKEVTR